MITETLNIIYQNLKLNQFKKFKITEVYGYNMFGE